MENIINLLKWKIKKLNLSITDSNDNEETIINENDYYNDESFYNEIETKGNQNIKTNRKTPTLIYRKTRGGSPGNPPNDLQFINCKL